MRRRRRAPLGEAAAAPARAARAPPVQASQARQALRRCQPSAAALRAPVPSTVHDMTFRKGRAVVDAAQAGNHLAKLSASAWYAGHAATRPDHFYRLTALHLRFGSSLFLNDDLYDALEKLYSGDILKEMNRTCEANIHLCFKRVYAQHSRPVPHSAVAASKDERPSLLATPLTLQAYKAGPLWHTSKAAAGAGAAAGGTATYTFSSVRATRLASAKVGRRVGKGTGRMRGSARDSRGASPPKIAAALMPGAWGGPGAGYTQGIHGFSVVARGSDDSRRAQPASHRCKGLPQHLGLSPSDGTGEAF